MDDVVDWLNKNSGAVQALATVFLVLLTTVYVVFTQKLAASAKEQAEATVRMAREAERAREESVRPFLLIQPVVETDRATSRELITLGYLAGQKEFPDVLECDLLNVGRGPALNVTLELMGPYGNTDKRLVQFDAGKELSKLPFRLEAGSDLNRKRSDARFIRIDYEDLLGNDRSAILQVELVPEHHTLRYELLSQGSTEGDSPQSRMDRNQ